MNSPYDDIDFMRCHVNYLATGNALFLWASYMAARRAGTRIPKHILEYLDNAAGAILSSVTMEAPKRRAGALMAALELAGDSVGKRSPFTEYHDRLNGIDADLAVDALAQMREWGEGKADYVFESVAKKHGTSKSTVRRHYVALIDAMKKTEESE